MNLREWALPVYTILIQIACGGMLVLWLIRTLYSRRFGRDELDQMTNTPMVVIFCTTVVGMIGAHFHLSKPLFSFLAILNFGASWLSREVVFTLIFCVLIWILLYLLWFKTRLSWMITGLGWVAIGFGGLTVYCMSRIYLMPTQVAWSTAGTIAAFYASTVLLGVMAMAALLIMDLVFSEVRKQEKSEVRPIIIQKSLAWLMITAIVAALLVLALYYLQIVYLSQGDESARTSLRLLMELYQPLFGMRLGLMVIGVGWLALAIFQLVYRKKSIQELLAPVYLSCLMVMIGEILGRFLFYATHVRVGI